MTETGSHMTDSEGMTHSLPLPWKIGEIFGNEPFAIPAGLRQTSAEAPLSHWTARQCIGFAQRNHRTVKQLTPRSGESR